MADTNVHQEYEVTPAEKEDWEKLAHALNKLAAIWGGAAIILGVTGAGAPAAVGAGVASAAFWWLSDVAGDVADDPPNPNYKERVFIKRVKPKLPLVRKPAIMAITSPTRLVFRALPSAVAALESLERFQAAKKAKDTRYSKLQGVRTRKLRKQTAKEISAIRKDLTQSIRGIRNSEVDIKVDHHAWKKAQGYIRKHGLPRESRDTLRQSGFTSTQVKRYEQWAARSYRNIVPPAKLSYLLMIGRNVLQKAETGLQRRLRR